MFFMKRTAAILITAAICTHSCTRQRLKLATTTSVENSGLLAALLPPFEERCGLKVDVIAVGTGQAIELGRRGDVDVILAHAPELEEKFIADGFGAGRVPVAHNDFVIVGEKGDPAGIHGSGTALDAFKKIASTGVVFVSRGDKSGTDTKEKAIWKNAGGMPSGRQYVEAGKGMEEVLLMANEMKAYTLADRGTFLAVMSRLSIDILFEGGDDLLNPYHIIVVNGTKKRARAEALISWVTSQEGQTMISGFKDGNGNVLFHPENLKPGEPSLKWSCPPK